jgi:uncharacterized alkaline shock family protein YloU
MLEQIIKEAGTNFKNANDQNFVADMYINIRYGIKLDFYVRSLIYAYDP